MAQKKDGMSAFAAGVMGALAGAAAVFFSDKKNRDMVKEKAKDLEGKASDQIKKMKDEVANKSEAEKKKLAGKLKKAGEELEGKNKTATR